MATAAPTKEVLLEAALRYAAMGFLVFPCLSGQKVPATAHGVKDGTTDVERIKSWWQSSPYNVGVCTGPESGIFVIDVDPRNGGAYAMPADGFPTVHTGGGGQHHYYRWPAGVSKMRPTLSTGVDVKGAGGYVIAPPSVTENVYVWLRDDYSIPEAPSDVLARIAIIDNQIVEQRPGDKFNDERTWYEILEPHGWQPCDKSFPHAQFDNWTRPGKDAGISATTGVRSGGAHGLEPSDLFYVFTTSTQFEAERGYDKFSVFAILNHGGDFSAAAAALAEETKPRLRPTVTGPLSSAPLTGAVGVPSGSPASAAPAYTYPTEGGRTTLLGQTISAYNFESATAAAHFVSKYIAYGNAITDAASEYHEACALALLSAVTAPVRIDLAFSPGGLRTNLFLALVGESSRSRKSTAQSIAGSLLGELLWEAMIPDSMSGEAGIQQLAQRSGKPAVWLPDELGQEIQQIYRRDFKSALENVLLQLYGGRTFRYVTLSGSNTVEDVHLVILGAATPESFAGSGNRSVTSGLLPRFGIVYPGTLPPSRPPRAALPEYAAMRAELKSLLYGVMAMVSAPGTKANVSLTPEAMETIAAADRAFSGSSMTSRLSTGAFKIAALLALADATWTVSQAHAVAAVKIAERWAAGALRLRAVLGRSAQDAAFNELLENARQVLENHSGIGTIAGRKRVRLADFAREIRTEYRNIERIQKTLLITEDIVIRADPETGETEWLWLPSKS